ncbi:MFS transporter [Haloferax larsenii]|uniref:MFS transporter n=1 Tax=Haloferax larsenii TaxID=302484 RepID=A0ABY5RF80_HALLR|nr:MFS transporter [Haloferax larsenii]UVE50252.1 MFS transporter [Haloferax larsenii]
MTSSPDPSRERRSRSVATRYYLYRSLDPRGFAFPIFVLFLLSRELSFTEIVSLSALQAVLTVAGEIPTGYVGDRIGRRNSIIVSRALAFVHLLGMVVAQSYPEFLAVWSLWALSLAFASGSEDAWLYDALGGTLAAERFTGISGRGTAIGQWSMALTMVVGAGLYILDPRYPFLASAVFALVGIVVVASLPGPRVAEETTPEIRVVLQVVRDAFAGRSLRSFVIYAGFFLGVTSAMEEFIQPVAVDAFEASLTTLPFRLPPEIGLGVLYATFAGVGAFGSFYAGDLVDRFGLGRTVFVIPILTGVVLAAPAVVAVIAVPSFFVMKGTRAAMKPIISGYLNDHIPSAGRATVLSAAAMVFALLRTPLHLFGGVVADAWSPLTAVIGFGVLFLLVSGVLYLTDPPVSGSSQTSAAQKAESPK